MQAAEQAWAETDLEGVGHCAVCEASRFVPMYSGLIDHDEGVPGSWNMSLCEDCGSLLLDPRPTPATLSRAYGSYYTHAAPDAENIVLQATGWVHGVIRHYLRGRYGLRAGDEVSGFGWLLRLAWPVRQQVDYFMRHLSRVPGRVLDIGCGSGGFLVRASMAGWQATGIEPDPAAADVARQNTSCVVHSDIGTLVERNFDAVTLAHVIEHLYEPRLMLARCLEVLRPGGWVWLATPNIHSLGHRLYREAWQPLETPRHLVMPPARQICRMMREAGFVEVEVLRRGRGSVKRLLASDLRARKLGRSAGMPRLVALLVDLAASVFPCAGEELVVVGRKPLK